MPIILSMNERIVRVNNESTKNLVIVKVDQNYKSFGARPRKKKDE